MSDEANVPLSASGEHSKGSPGGGGDVAPPGGSQEASSSNVKPVSEHESGEEKAEEGAQANKDESAEGRKDAGAEEEEARSGSGGDGSILSPGAREEDDADDLAAVGIPANEVKNIILQVLSPYFDDDGGVDTGGMEGGVAAPAGMLEDGAHAPDGGDGAGAAAGEEGRGPGGGNSAGAASPAAALPPALEDVEDTAQRYEHIKAKSWVQLICDGITERLVAMGKPYKFVTHIVVMRKCGAGMHVCSSNYYSQTDGWLSHAHDLSPHIYAVVTVYWMAI